MAQPNYVSVNRRCALFSHGNNKYEQILIVPVSIFLISENIYLLMCPTHFLLSRWQAFKYVVMICNVIIIIINILVNMYSLKKHDYYTIDENAIQ